VSRARRNCCRYVLAAALATAACAAAAQPSDAPATPTSRSIRLKEVERSSPGKPQPPIAAAYRLSARPTIGEPLRVVVTARAAASLGELSIEVSTADGASLASPPRALAGATPDEYAWEISIAPLSSATGRVNVLVKGSSVDGSQARSLSVLLGAAPSAQAAKVRVASNGERLIALPAQESRADGSSAEDIR
jgi:hypothetical protein